MTIAIGLIAVFIALINFLYLVNKDNFLKFESEKDECIKTLKYVFEKVIKIIINKQKMKESNTNAICDQKSIDTTLSALSEIVFSLRYLNLISDNSIEKEIQKFGKTITDYQSASISDEDFFGVYQDIMEKIYKTRQPSLCLYFKRIFRQKV